MRLLYRFLVSVILFLFTGLLLLRCYESRTRTTVSASALSVTGKWVITEQNVARLSIIPRCASIGKGTVFNFRSDSVEISPDASSAPCDAFRFKVKGNTISFIKGDMIWLCTYACNADRLEITSLNFFSPAVADTSASLNQAPITNEIKVTLTKIN